MTSILAWHFTGDKLRDGSPIPPVGQVLKHPGPILLCESGLHASKRIMDALLYAPGHMIHRVSLGGTVYTSHDKLVASERTIIATIDGEKILRKFARLCALDVIDNWDAPDVVREFLKTGDEALRLDAQEASWSALQSGMKHAKWCERHAMESAARSAEMSAARHAARSAAWYAAYSACPVGSCAAGCKQNKRLTGMVMRVMKKEQQ